MAFEPNLSNLERATYGVAGAVLVAWGLWGATAHWSRTALPILGALVVLEGVIGY